MENIKGIFMGAALVGLLAVAYNWQLRAGELRADV